MSDELREAQRALEAACADRDELRVIRDALTRQNKELESRLDTANQKLADMRHAWEHAEEIGRMDHYAANTIKEALKP